MRGRSTSSLSGCRPHSKPHACDGFGRVAAEPWGERNRWGSLCISACVMKLSPFGVSFDGPLDRGERWRARAVACALGGAILFVASGGLSALLHASSGVLASWTNGRPEVSTTGVASRDEQINRGATTQSVLAANAAVRAEAVVAAAPKRDLRKSEVTARVKSRPRSQSQKIRQDRDPWRTRDDAAIELRWRERAAEIERRSPRNDFFR
jgi:hypothetical protein